MKSPHDLKLKTKVATFDALSSIEPKAIPVGIGAGKRDPSKSDAIRTESFAILDFRTVAQSQRKHPTVSDGIGAIRVTAKGASAAGSTYELTCRQHIRLGVADMSVIG